MKRVDFVSLFFLSSLIFVRQQSWADEGFRLSRDPEHPKANSQHRLILDLPNSSCGSLAGARPSLPSSDLVISTSKRPVEAGCRFIWVIHSAELPDLALPEIEIESSEGAKNVLRRASNGEKATKLAGCPIFSLRDFDCHSPTGIWMTPGLYEPAIHADSAGNYLLDAHGAFVTKPLPIVRARYELQDVYDFHSPKHLNTFPQVEYSFECQDAHTFLWRAYVNGAERVMKYEFADGGVSVKGESAVVVDNVVDAQSGDCCKFDVLELKNTDEFCPRRTP